MTFDWARGRTDTYRYVLVDAGGREVGTLDGISGGTLNFNAFTDLKVSGTLNYIGADLPWRELLVRIYMDSKNELREETTTCLATMRTTTPKRSVNNMTKTYSVEMFSTLVVLQQDVLESTFTATAGSVVTDVIDNLIKYAGLIDRIVTPSDSVLANDVVIEAGTTRLAAANALCAAINYMSLNVSATGQVLAEPFTLPSYRTPTWTFRDDEDGLFLPEVGWENDDYAIPNVVVCIGSDGETETVGRASNTDPASPYSTVSRGRRIVRYESGLTFADQASANAYAERLLSNGMRSVETISFEHAHVPVDIFDLVTFDYRDAGLTRTMHVEKMDKELSAGCMTKTTVRWYL